jgi:hypothetical protein
MIYINLKGRMCNQMFQIAAAKALSIDNDVDFVCSNSVSGISPTINQTKKYRKTIFEKIKFQNFTNQQKIIHHGSPDFSYKEIIYQDNICLTGYYQSENYFKHRKDEIHKLFECPEKIRKFIFKNFDHLISNPNTCSVHIRRGDYLKLKEYHTNLTSEYYNSCFKKTKDKHLVFFSDDIEWCKTTFQQQKATFVNTKSDIIDFYIMSFMKNNIIANSSFSWWAAWLNNNKSKKVFAPKKWFGPKNAHLDAKDLIPTKWEVLDVKN